MVTYEEDVIEPRANGIASMLLNAQAKSPFASRSGHSHTMPLDLERGISTAELVSFVASSPNSTIVGARNSKVEELSTYFNGANQAGPTNYRKRAILSNIDLSTRDGEKVKIHGLGATTGFVLAVESTKGHIEEWVLVPLMGELHAARVS